MSSLATNPPDTSRLINFSSFSVQIGGGLMSLSKSVKTANLGLHIYRRCCVPATAHRMLLILHNIIPAKVEILWYGELETGSENFAPCSASFIVSHHSMFPPVAQTTFQMTSRACSDFVRSTELSSVSSNSPPPKALK